MRFNHLGTAKEAGLHKNTKRNGRTCIFKKRGIYPISTQPIRTMKYRSLNLICLAQYVNPKLLRAGSLAELPCYQQKSPFQKCSSLQDVRDKCTPFINKKQPLDTTFRAFLSAPKHPSCGLQTSTTLPESNAWVESLSKVNLHQSWCRVPISNSTL